MHYISHIIERLLLLMTLKRNFLIFTFITLFTACTSTILIENLGDAAKGYLEGVGHQFSIDAAITIDVSVTTKEKIKYDDFRFYGYPMYRSYLYEPDRINSIPEFFLRISVRDEELDKTLWTGLTKWRKGSSYAPTDIPSAEMLVENLLVNL